MRALLLYLRMEEDMRVGILSSSTQQAANRDLNRDENNLC